MNDTTTKTADNVIPRRRATDWQKHPTVTRPDVFGWFEGDGAAILQDRAFARVSAALSGAQAITAVLMQAAIDRKGDERDSPLHLCERVEHGLFAALASCLEAAEIHSGSGSAAWTTRAHADSDEERAVSATVQSINAARYRKSAGKGAA